MGSLLHRFPCSDTCDELLDGKKLQTVYNVPVNRDLRHTFNFVTALASGLEQESVSRPFWPCLIKFCHRSFYVIH